MALIDVREQKVLKLKNKFLTLDTPCEQETTIIFPLPLISIPLLGEMSSHSHKDLDNTNQSLSCVP